MLGQERFELEPEVIFVLGMRLSVTKNDILMFFSSVGMIAVDHASKPRTIKGCLNGSKFMGETITVLPAYLSTRKGRGIRYRYPREFAPSNNREHQQDRQQQNRQRRPRKWRPARDNWYCMSCRNSNFVWRSNCNRCKASKSEYAAEPLFSGSPSFMRRWNRCHAPKTVDTPKPVTPPRSDKWELKLGSD
ncbi:uncharacterized protein Dwil_GK28328 [Drosophila willistoni]|uniref:RanBP2-type domain-containing protein n=1 Tax=Drosophila willistoni TaxID=7260 RepID=A0A0Q9X6K3_DROWI|nr:uncharacterized protein Dwil_GK28328 [Drosophila willistoni]